MNSNKLVISVLCVLVGIHALAVSQTAPGFYDLTASEQTDFMTSCRLRLRDSPTHTGTIIKTLEKHTKVTVLQEGKTDTINKMKNRLIKIKKRK